MALRTVYVCSHCGETFVRWTGQCSNCHSWNTIEEDTIEVSKGGATKAIEKKKKLINTGSENSNPQILFDISADDNKDRIKTNMHELDRVLGGGFVKGSVILLSGEPGAGKSTLILHVCEALKTLNNILYVTGEESVSQIKLRANRLGVEGKNVSIVAESNVSRILEIIKKDKPDIFVIDSIQTMVCDEVESSAGSITQVKESAAKFLEIAKENDIPTIIIGHVNKDGAIAGPKVLEHIVDTVLYFEGDKMLPFRILRAVKNRYGSTNEIGMFDMTSKGLKEILNPSATLLDGRPKDVSGSCITCIIEGTRPVLSEIQALTNTTAFGMPRRTSSGFDNNRANLLYAVIEKRTGYSLNNKDIYINIVGGLSIDETACDLAVAIATISSVLDKPCPDDLISIGEIGLGGEIRSVNFVEARIKEAEHLGFKKIIIPETNMKQLDSSEYKIKIIPIRYLKEIITKVFTEK